MKNNIDLGIIIVCFIGLFTFASAEKSLTHWGFSSKVYNIDKFAQFTSLDGTGGVFGVFYGISIGDFKPGLSEIKNDVKVFYGFGGGKTKITPRYEIGDIGLLSFSWDVSNRIYALPSIYVAPKVGLALNFMSGKLLDYGGSTESIGINSFSGLIGVEFGYNIASYKELLLSVDYDLSIYNGKAKLENDFESEAEISRGLSISVSFRVDT